VLGNLDAKRDWGHARDYVEAQWLILQQKRPDDYVIASGKNYSVKDFINLCAGILKINLKWKGKGISTKAYDQRGNCVIRCHKRYFRPAEVDQLLGNALKAKKKLKWKPKTSFKDLVKEMLHEDLKIAENAISEQKR
jgi:GDPmannose 4,6-dehydratase